MTAKRALITGITGMVGSHLADYLLANTGWDIYGMCRWRSPLDNVGHLLDQLIKWIEYILSTAIYVIISHCKMRLMNAGLIMFFIWRLKVIPKRVLLHRLPRWIPTFWERNDYLKH